jgi:hypothetical protein
MLHLACISHTEVTISGGNDDPNFFQQDIRENYLLPPLILVQLFPVSTWEAKWTGGWLGLPGMRRQIECAMRSR